MAGAFAAPVPLYRPTWAARTLEQEADGWFFARLLRQVAPAAYATLPNQSGAKCFRALVEHCRARFPMVELNGKDVFEGWDGRVINICTAAREEGMLVDVRGFNQADYYGGGSVLLSVLARLVFNTDDATNSVFWDIEFLVDPPEEADLERQLRDEHVWSDELMAVLTRRLDRGFRKAPRGRAWLAPWNGLTDLMAWLTHSTGSLFLDYGDDDFAESGEWPAWDAEEIAALASDWKRYAPMWDRILALAQYLLEPKAADRAQRLLLMAKLLTGDQAARRLCSEPKPARRRTLADVFTKGTK